MCLRNIHFLCKDSSCKIRFLIIGNSINQNSPKIKTKPTQGLRKKLELKTQCSCINHNIIGNCSNSSLMMLWVFKLMMGMITICGVPQNTQNPTTTPTTTHIFLLISICGTVAPAWFCHRKLIISINQNYYRTNINIEWIKGIVLFSKTKPKRCVIHMLSVQHNRTRFVYTGNRKSVLRLKWVGFLVTKQIK